MHESKVLTLLTLLTILCTSGYVAGQSSGIIFSSSFEDSTFSKYLHSEKCCTKSILLSDKYARKDKHSAKFELQAGDPLVFNGKRSELVAPKEPVPFIERWYGFSIFPEYNILPSDTTFEILAQWHEVHDAQLGEKPRSPPISLQVKNGNWQVVILWAVDKVNTNKTVSGTKTIQLGKCNPYQWTDWIFHIKFSYTDDGFIEIWQNNKLLTTYHGPNYYNDEKGSFFKIGIYKPEWNKWKDNSIPSKIIYFDCLKIGNANAQLSQFTF